jgi:hypothetical protein
MATYQLLEAADIATSKQALEQLVDFIQNDISGGIGNTRRKYQTFVTGGVGPGITSSLFQTIYDQDYTLQTANPAFDMTVGIFSGSNFLTSSGSPKTGQDSAGKMLFSSQSVMMREKINVYRQFAQVLLGDADGAFTAPFGSAVTVDATSTGGASGGLVSNVSGHITHEVIQFPLFLTFKRLFSRDQITRDTFAIKMYQSASRPAGGKPNLNITSERGAAIFTDIGSSTSLLTSYAGNVGNIIDGTTSKRNVGLIFYDQGIAVLALEKIISGSEHVSGTIAAMNAASNDGKTGRMLIGAPTTQVARGTNPFAKFIPDLMVSASIDDIVDHVASCRYSSGSFTAMTYKNITFVNSTLIFCRATAGNFNYSSNPTYVDSSNNIVVIDEAARATGLQRAFSFITTIGLYDDSDTLLAVAKLSRPVEKNDEKDLTIRVRLDF